MHEQQHAESTVFATGVMTTFLLQAVFWILVLVGHLGIWCLIFNRSHATAWPRFWRKLIEKAIILLVLTPFVGYPLAIFQNGTFQLELLMQHPLALVYASFCAVSSFYFLVTWLIRIATHRVPAAVQLVETRYIKVADELKRKLTHGSFANLLSRVPFNQATDLSLETRHIALSKMKEGVSLRICQISDFHLTGHIDIAFFRHLVSLVNEWKPDIVFVTGDLIDETPCLDWIQPVFEPLHAPLGCYYLLGNHDRRMPSESEERLLLEKVGLIRSGGLWHDLEFHGQRIKIAGNELPWYQGAEQLEPCDDDEALQILLTHSPDQIDWARLFGFDLIFAGHTHGGQIRLPIVGPIISPSKYGVKYAGGTFREGSAIMHVNRGICGDEPIRLNCPPEISFFVVEKC
ncbi:MAG: metallophosphoesterase [Pirellulaceae bacterium]